MIQVEFLNEFESFLTLNLNFNFRVCIMTILQK